MRLNQFDKNRFFYTEILIRTLGRTCDTYKTDIYVEWCYFYYAIALCLAYIKHFRQDRNALFELNVRA